jgi:hypothetical protein
MAKKAKAGGAKREKARERRERQFEPAALVTANVVYLIGGLGSVLMGAGTWGQFGAMLQESAPAPFKFAPYVLAAGALLVGLAIWIGTSGDPALRVGDAGLAVLKGNLRRMPWYAIDKIAWREETVRIAGKDDLGVDMAVAASLKVHPQAAAWIVKEARERIPAVVDVPEDATLPAPLASAGVTLPLEPPQVVGRHCAQSGKVIAYEPDARVCPRCERVFHRSHVPETCACGASLADMRPAETAG